MKPALLLAMCALPFSVSPGAPAQAAPKASALALEDVAWLAGHWREQAEGAVTEELWMPPRGGVMLGLNRGLQGERKASFEYLRLETDAQGVVYQASPGGAAPTPFRLTAADASHAVFENPAHDFPKRIEYRLAGDVLTASIAGDQPGPSWTFRRVGQVE
jgi:hypothetical protein